MAATASPQQLSPKFTVPLIVGVLVFAGGEALSLVTVEAFNFAGEAWAGVLHKFVTVAAMGATAYYKMDPLRQNYAKQIEAEEEDARAKRLADLGAGGQSAVVPGAAQVVTVVEGEPVPYTPPSNLAG